MCLYFYANTHKRHTNTHILTSTQITYTPLYIHTLTECNYRGPADIDYIQSRFPFKCNLTASYDRFAIPVRNFNLAT